MNISSLTIYLWQLADSIAHLFFVLCFISAAGAAFAAICAFVETHSSSDEFLEKSKAWARRFSISFFALAVANTILPSSNTIAMMVVIPQIAESKVVQKDLPDLYNAAVEALKASLKK